MVEVRGVEPLCPGPSRAASTYIASLWISPRKARGRALLPWPAVVEDTAVRSRRPSPLFLLSTFPAPSRSRSGNVTALRRPLAFLRCCRLFFRRGINERPPTLDRQLRTPTKGRIRNTPRKWEATGDHEGAPSKNRDRATCHSWARLQAPARLRLLKDRSARSVNCGVGPASVDCVIRRGFSPGLLLTPPRFPRHPTCPLPPNPPPRKTTNPSPSSTCRR